MSLATAKRRPSILGVSICHSVDESPDTSRLGEFTDSPSGWRVDRQTGHLVDESGAILADNLGATIGRHEYRYVSGFQHSGELSAWSHVSDSGVHSAYLHVRYRNNSKRGRRCNGFSDMGVIGWATAQTRAEKIRVLDAFYCCSDTERLESAARGDWYMIGISAVAEFHLSDDTVQKIHSGGLWGIESDSGADYIASVESNELAQLASNLRELGFSARAVKRAIASATRPD